MSRFRDILVPRGALTVVLFHPPDFAQAEGEETGDHRHQRAHLGSPHDLHPCRAFKGLAAHKQCDREPQTGDNRGHNEVLDLHSIGQWEA